MKGANAAYLRSLEPGQPAPNARPPDGRDRICPPLKKQTRRRCSGVPGAGFAYWPGRGISPDRKRRSNGAKAEAAAEQTLNLRPRPHALSHPFMDPVMLMGLPRTDCRLQPGLSI